MNEHHTAEKMKWAVTGTTGYVGSRIRDFLKKKRCDVYSLSRKPDPLSDHTLSFSLDRILSPEPLEGLDVLVHCAYDFQVSKWPDIERINIEGTKKLFRTARSAQVKHLIFISSMSAFPGCASQYGKAKLQIEGFAASQGAFILRPGLVYDSHSGGMIGALSRVIQTSRLVPLIGNGTQPFYLVHSEDLCHLVWKAGLNEIPTGVPVLAACEKPLTLKQILLVISKSKKRRVAFFPLPVFLMKGILNMAETIGLQGRLRSDGLTSLLYLPQNPDFMWTRQSKVPFREFSIDSLRERI